MNDLPGALKRQDVQRRFERAASNFNSADFVHRHTAAGLFDRLLPMQIDAACVLNLGSATGRDHPLLKKRFRAALVFGLDQSRSMLLQARRNRSWFSRVDDIQADAMRLPVADGSVDLVYANLLLPWIDNLPACFAEIARALRKDGLFVFSTLGPDSFRELCDQSSENSVRVFPDMHIVGDELVKSRLRDPVLDVDTLSLEYRDPDRLFRDLRNAAAGNSLRSRRRTLSGKGRVRALRDRLTGNGAVLPFTITLELVYGHAWGDGPAPVAGEYRVAAGGIGRRRR